MRIAFDVDGTLFDEHNQPRLTVIEMLLLFAERHTVIVWSGGGIDYARRRLNQINLDNYVTFLPKQAGQGIDLCFDDQEVKLATVNVQI